MRLRCPDIGPEKNRQENTRAGAIRDKENRAGETLAGEHPEYRN